MGFGCGVATDGAGAVALGAADVTADAVGDGVVGDADADATGGVAEGSLPSGAVVVGDVDDAGSGVAAGGSLHAASVRAAADRIAIVRIRAPSGEGATVLQNGHCDSDVRMWRRQLAHGRNALMRGS